jgi:hypothetical protein
MSHYRDAVERFKQMSRADQDKALAAIKAQRDELDRQWSALRRAQKEVRRETAKGVLAL